MQAQIEHAAFAASRLSQAEYEATDLINILSYDIARLAARDRNYPLCVSISCDTKPQNIGAALLKMCDDIRVELGGTRQNEMRYAPVWIIEIGTL